MLEITVHGKPEPQGSTKAFVPTHPRTGEPYRRAGGGIVVNVTSDNPQLKAWREAVARIADGEYIDDPVDGPLVVEATFYLRRPDSHYGTGRNAGVLKAWAIDLVPTTRPDVDKLLRGILDALSGVVWADDAQVVDAHPRKRYADRQDEQRAEIKVRPFDPVEAGASAQLALA